MKIAVSTGNNQGFDAGVDMRFGRAPYFAVIDTGTMEVEFISNEATGAASGAGIMAAQKIVDAGVEGVISGNFGPKAFNTLQAAELKLYSYSGGTLKEAVEAFKKGDLEELGNPTSRAHSGLR